MPVHIGHVLKGAISADLGFFLIAKDTFSYISNAKVTLRIRPVYLNSVASANLTSDLGLELDSRDLLSRVSVDMLCDHLGLQVFTEVVMPQFELSIRH